MKKEVSLHYILFIAGLGLVGASCYLLFTDGENLVSKSIVAFAGLFVMFGQYTIIKMKNKQR